MMNANPKAVRKQVGETGEEFYLIGAEALGPALGIHDIPPHLSYDVLEAIADEIDAIATAMNEENPSHISNKVAVRMLERLALRANGAAKIDHALLVQDAEHEEAKAAE